MRVLSTIFVAAAFAASPLSAQVLTGSAHSSLSGGVRFDTSLTAAPGSFASLYVGFAPARLPTPTPYGILYLDPSQPLLAFGMALDPTGAGTLPLQVPRGLSEVNVTCQAVVIDPGGQLTISNMIGFGCFQPPVWFPPPAPVILSDWDGASQQLSIAYAGLPSNSQIEVWVGTVQNDGSVLYSALNRTIATVSGNGTWTHNANLAANQILDVRVVDGATGQVYDLGEFRRQ